MSIATVVTRGYGSFGSVNKLPTLGYSIGIPAVVIPPTSVRFQVSAPRMLPHAEVPYAVNDASAPANLPHAEAV